MSITLSDRSRKAMAGLHPDLIRVIERAAESATASEDFLILEGVRSKEQMWINYGKGRSVAECAAKGVPAKYSKPGDAKVTWLNNPLMSNHRLFPDGFGHAFDAAPFPINWNDWARFVKIANLIKRAAKAEGVNLAHGIDWKKPDAPHHELAG